MANTDSIFYKIGAQVKQSIDNSISSVPQLTADNLFYGDNKFYGNTQIGSQTGFTLRNGSTDKIQIYGISNSQTYVDYTVSEGNNGTANPSSVTFTSGTGNLVITLNRDNTTETLADLVAIINSTDVVEDAFYAFVIDPSTSSELVGTIGTITPATTFNSSHGGKLTVVNDATFTNNLSISGNLIVTGTTTTLTSSELQIEDNFITLSKGASTSSDYWRDSGLYFERAVGLNNTAFLWDESAEEFVLGEISSSGVQYHTTISHNISSGYNLNGTDITATGSGQVVSTGINGTAISTIDLNLGDSLRFIGDFGAGLDFELQDATTNAVNLITEDGQILQQFTSGTPVNFTPTATGDYTFFQVGGNSQNFQIVVSASVTTNDGHDVFNVTPGPLKAGSLSITDSGHGQLELGDLTDFTTGLTT
jgi:hypothetical protein